MALLENFVSIIKNIANQKKIHLSSFGWIDISHIGKSIKSRETKASDVIRQLQQRKELKLGLDDHDWRELEKVLDRLIRS